MATPSKNLNALLIGTGEFSFSDGATSPADTLLKGWLDFGNIVAFSPTLKLTEEEHCDSYRAPRRPDGRIITGTGMRYVLKCDEWNQSNLLALFGGSSATGLTQSVQSAVTGDAWVFTTNAASGTEKWYDVKVAGVRIRKLTTVTIATLTEGTDFEVDTVLGRVRFLASQTTSRTPVVTAPAITAGSADSFLGIVPLQKAVRKGYGRVVVFDQYASNRLALDHADFSCELSVASSGEMTGMTVPEIALNVDVTQAAGTVYVREILPAVAAALSPASYDGLIAWWKTEAITGLNDGDPVSSWPDSSGSVNTLTGSGTTRPLYKTSIFGSRPSVQFDGTNDRLVLTSTFTFITNPLTIIAVLKSNPTNDGMLFGHSTWPHNHQCRMQYGVNEINLLNEDSAGGYSSVLGGAWTDLRMLIWRSDGTTISFRQNKTARGTVSMGGTQYQFNWMGNTSFGLPFGGDMGEVCVYNTRLTDAQLDALYDGYFKLRFTGLP